MARILNIFHNSFNNNPICSFGSSLFTFMDVFLTILSIGSFLADIGTDVVVLIQYYMNGHLMWMLLTTSLVCIPSLVVQIFSIRWYIIDGSVTNLLWLVHVLQLGVFLRYIRLLSLGLKVRQNSTQDDLERFHQQQSDICMLRLFESFMESAPQLVLQLYIMVSTDEWNPWTGISAIASLFSLSWGIAAYSKAMRNIRPEKKHLSWWGLLFQSLWHIGMVSSRIFAMVLFATTYGSWLILVMAIHWICMTVWVFLQKTDFCATWWEERLYNCVVGVIYCFCYFNIKEGRSRFRISIYYFLTILQNVSFLVAFYVAEKSSEGLKFLAKFLVPSGIVIGLIGMMLYYRFFHPSGPIALCTQKAKVGALPTAKDYQCKCCTLKTCRKVLKENINISCKWSNTSQLLSVDFINHSKNMDTSRISMNSIPENTILCAPDLHRSHSLNCSYASCDITKISESSFEVIHNRKSSANHHKNINYHFRPAANQGLLSSKIHCSCLVLMKDTNLKNDSVQQFIKHSNSLPNLDGSFDSEPSECLDSSFISCGVDETCSGNTFEQKSTVTEQRNNLWIRNNNFTPLVKNSKSLKSVNNFDYNPSKNIELPLISSNIELLNSDNSSAQNISTIEQKYDPGTNFEPTDNDNAVLNIKEQSKSLPNIENVCRPSSVNRDLKSSSISCSIKLSGPYSTSARNLHSNCKEQVIGRPIINKDHIVRHIV